MADDTSKSGGQDCQGINVNHDYELRDWSKSAVALGDRADTGWEYLNKK